MIRRTVLFSGHVQGVGFRYTACRIALNYGVTGYVRNLPDGRVEAVIEGEAAEVDKFVQAVQDAMSGSIRGVSVNPGREDQDAAATREFARFEVRF